MYVVQSGACVLRANYVGLDASSRGGAKEIDLAVLKVRALSVWWWAVCAC